jgi:pilus assembly protein CpaF
MSTPGSPRPGQKPPQAHSTPASPATSSSVLQRVTHPELKATTVPKQRTPPRIAELRSQLRTKLLASPAEADEWTRNDRHHQQVILDRLNVILQRTNTVLDQAERALLEHLLLDDLLGYGAITPLLLDKTVTEVMVNGPEVIFAEAKGKLYETEITFDDNEHVNWVAQRIVRRLGRSFDRNNPMTDARLPDGSRVHLIMPPAALQGTTITVRKFPERVLTIADLISFGSITPDVATFLEACVVAKLNIVVSGGTGSGKTTLLNVLSAYIPHEERIVTIEDAAELQLVQRHVVRLETAPPLPGRKDDLGKLAIRDLVRGSLRMRPDRIVVGECRGGEALDMLQAMNTGQDGSLTTVHSNSPRDAIARLETLCLMAGMDLPVSVIRRQIASAVNLIIQVSRLKDGSRKVTQITEVQGIEGDQLTMQDIFVMKTDEQGKVMSLGGGALPPR